MPHLTHFLCLPLITPTSRPLLEKALHTFKDELLHLPNTIQTDIAGSPQHLNSLIHSRAIRPVGTLHLTLGVMSLKEEGQLARAVELLEGVDVGGMLANTKTDPTKTKTDTSQPLCVSLSGLASMHAPARTSVLYTDPHDASNRLLPFCEQLRDMFMKQGLIVDEKRALKLHVTVVNTIYMKGRKLQSDGSSNKEGDVEEGAEKKKQRSGRRRGAGGTVRIDARPVLERFREFVCAEEVMLDRVAICEMGAEKVVDEKTGEVVEEAYREVAVKSLVV